MAKSPDASRPSPKRPPSQPRSLLKAKGHTRAARKVVEAAAVEVSAVSTTLKREIAQGTPNAAVKEALDHTEIIEDKLEKSEDELVSVNAALADGIRERRGLHDELAKTHDALARTRREARQAKSDALHDALTGLPNFTLFKDRLELALVQSRRHHWRAGVMFIDLDRFKEVNDTHGHGVGDLCLKEIADRLEAATRGDDTICRRSGDEFQFLMIEAGERPAIAAVAAKLAAAIGSVCQLGAVEVSVTASIGMAVFPDDGHTAQELLEKADAAMYASKRSRKGPVFWSEIDAAQALDADTQARARRPPPA